MNDSQVKELLQHYDELRELMVRMNADMDQVKNRYSQLSDKGEELNEKMSGIETRINKAVKDAASKIAASTVNNVPPQQKIVHEEKPQSLSDFFRSQGLEVIDKRPSGGNLWITGDKEKMDQAVKLAKTKYGVSGSYGSGRATKQRPGWFTNSSK